MNNAEDGNKKMEEKKDREKDSLPPFIYQPQADFLAKFLGSCGVMAEPSLWDGRRGLQALHASPLCFVALIVGSARNASRVGVERGSTVRKVEARGAFRSSHSERKSN